MNKQIRLISALAFAMTILSISTLANAEVILNVTEATLVAKGAGVDVSVQVTCNQSFGDSQVNVTGMLTQRVGNSITNTFLNASERLTCTGVAQNLDILALVNSPGVKAFKSGTAFINLSGLAFSQVTFEFDFGNFQQEIQIRH
jgi:hypothetical protein